MEGQRKVATAARELEWPLPAMLASLVFAGCIIPDTDVNLVPERTNRGAVRIVAPVGLTPEAHVGCAESEPVLRSCPVPPDTVVPGLVQPPGQTFCRCPDADLDALGVFHILVEDPDVDGEGLPIDTILGAFLLDPPDLADDPSEYVAYTNYLPTTAPAQLHPQGGGIYSDAIDRPDPHLKSWTLGSPAMDLCNDNNGSKLLPGLHALRLIVTDRPWYVPVQRNDKGVPIRNSDGPLRRDASARVGVPDIPGGATYDVASFVFRCVDSTDPEEGASCSCAQVE
jgi:hypothetical protein